MRQLHIPRLGEVFVLAKNWDFHLKNERRNKSLLEWLGYTIYPGYWAPLNPVEKRFRSVYYSTSSLLHGYSGPQTKQEPYWQETSKGPAQVQGSLTKGTALKVDRIYIRAGSPSFDSITFKTHLHGEKKVIRFFVSLEDVDKMYIV